MTLSNSELYTQEAGTKIETEVTIKYTALAYERYDGSVGYILSKDGKEIGTATPANLRSFSTDWSIVQDGKVVAESDPRATESFVAAAEAPKVPAKRAPKTKAEPQEESK